MQADAAVGRAVQRTVRILLLCASITRPFSSPATILWSDLGATLAHHTGLGKDILAGAVKRDDSSSDTLYFKFHVNPSSEAGTEQYLAGFQLFEGDTERLGVGNAREAWAYSAFAVADTGVSNKVDGEIDFNS